MSLAVGGVMRIALLIGSVLSLVASGGLARANEGEAVRKVIEAALDVDKNYNTPAHEVAFLTPRAPSAAQLSPLRGDQKVKEGWPGWLGNDAATLLANGPGSGKFQGYVHQHKVDYASSGFHNIEMGQRTPFAAPVVPLGHEVIANAPVGTTIQVALSRQTNGGSRSTTGTVVVTRQDETLPAGVAHLSWEKTSDDIVLSKENGGKFLGQLKVDIHTRSIQRRTAKMTYAARGVR
jgi:hypothetical protein